MQTERPSYDEWMRKKKEDEGKLAAVALEEEARMRECGSSSGGGIWKFAPVLRCGWGVWGACVGCKMMAIWSLSKWLAHTPHVRKACARGGLSTYTKPVQMIHAHTAPGAHRRCVRRVRICLCPLGCIG